jgi:hypothetical protein
MTSPNFGAYADFACRASIDCSFAIAERLLKGDIEDTCVLINETKPVPEGQCPVEFKSNLGKAMVMAAEGATND